MRIKNVVFHHLMKEQKTKGNDSVKHEYANDLLKPTDQIVINLCEDILKSYRDQNPMHGNIANESDFKTTLESFYNDNPIEFMDFTINVTNLIKNELSKSFLANGGFILFLNYEESNKNWLLIAMLKNDEGYGLTNLLTLEKRQYLNIDKLNESARIDIEKWKQTLSSDEENSTHYLSFMKGRKSQDDDITEYFRFALSCEGYITSKQNTKNIVETIFEYMAHKEIAPIQQEIIRESLFLYFEEQHRIGEEVDLQTISNKVSSEEPSDFTNYLKNNQINIDFAFKPNPNSYKRFKKIGYTQGNIKVSFTYNDINESISLSSDGYLIIKSVPKNIIDEITRATPQTNND